MAEYASMFVVSGLAVMLYLGGWHAGLLPFEPTEQFGLILGSVLDAAVFTGKCVLLVGVMIWARWSLPRLRIDQVMTTCLKYLLPISCGLLLLVCLWELTLPAAWKAAARYVVFGASVLGLVWAGWVLAGWGLSAPPGRLPGAWADADELAGKAAP
jgi:NADH-quinone oxidoreductase subunit H